MNKTLKYAAIAFAATVMTAGFTSCSKDNDDNKADDQSAAKNTLLEAAEKQYTNDVVVATYKSLADATEQLVADVYSLKDDASVEKACADWKKARKFWEFSEAFLYGAASDYGIDPHIDTWPFDETAFNTHLATFDPDNETSVQNMQSVISTGQNLTGFHALEYLIFRDGAPRKYADMTEKEKLYAVMVAEDLYIHSAKLEAAWAGIENVSADRAHALEDAEQEPSKNYGEYMINAGKAGSIYTTRLAAAIAIIDGCSDIADEVASSKIGKPNTGEDVTYIESPHAYNSIVDFYDNIMSCKHALYGTMGNTSVDFDASITSPSANSVMQYALTYCPAQAQVTMTKLEAALTAVKSMKAPFVKNYTDASAKAATAAISEFDESLTELKAALVK